MKNFIFWIIVFLGLVSTISISLIIIHWSLNADVRTIYN